MMGLIIMKKSMKKFLFIAFVLLGIVACKEDLSEYYNRLEQRKALNKRVEDDNASLEAQNVNRLLRMTIKMQRMKPRLSAMKKSGNGMLSRY